MTATQVRSWGPVCRGLGFDEDGAAALRPVLLVPTLMIVVAGGRVWFGRASVDVGRVRSTRCLPGRTPTQAAHDAEVVAHADLGVAALHCPTASIEVDTAGFALPLVNPAR